MAPNPSAVAIQAAGDGNLRLLKKMAKKIDLRGVTGPSGWNVVHFAAAKDRLEVCRFLVEESGLDVNGATANGETPIALAAAAGKVSVLRYLLDHGGDPAVADANGRMPLHAAAENGHCDALRLLLSRGVDVDPLSNRLVTPLHLAVGKGQDQALKVLLEHGADPNRVSHNMFSPLMLACYADVGSLKSMKLLVEAGADVNFRSRYEPTPLMMAVLDGSTDIVKFLLEAGADANLSHENLMPITAAAAEGRRDLVEILFPWTKPIESLPNWSLDGIMTDVKYLFSLFMVEAFMDPGRILSDTKPRGNEAFAKGDYLAAAKLYDTAMLKDPLDATLFANRSLCWLRLGDGQQALSDAQQCKILRPGWSKAWYREGAALRLLKNYKGAANAFVEALKLDPASDEIKTSLREAIETLRCAACSGEENS